MHFDWQALLQQLAPIIIAWVLGSLGVGIPKLTPSRVMNKPEDPAGGL